MESSSSRTLPEAGVPVSEPHVDGPDLPTVPRAVYQVGDEIARGGLGRIYRARDLRLDRVVAIKELLNPTSGNQRRFLREIEVTVGLEHPNIVSIHEAGRWPDEQPFYSMNYVRGSTLLAAMEECETLNQRLTLLPAMIAVAEAVAYAHDKGVIHRDLKPANVLVGRFGETVVIDWGLAKYTGTREVVVEQRPVAGPGHTRLGAVVGTPPYMPPEQARGEAVEASADVYALGAMLYQLLSGRAPFADVPPDRLIDAIQKQSPTPLSRLVPELAPDLLAIVEKAMGRDAAKRYLVAREMVEELRHFSAGRLVGAYSYSIADLLGRFIRRHASSVVTAVVALILLLASASYSVSTIRGERDTAQRHAREAEEARDRAEARSRALIVAQALALTDSDPTEAVARLKQLSRPTQGAISVAARAQELGVAEAILPGAGNQLGCATFSPDARRVAAAGESQDVVLWSLTGPTASVPFGQAAPVRLSAHSERISDCVFSPSGQQLGSTGYDGQVILWNVDDKTQRILQAPGGPMRSLRFSADGARLAGVSAQGVARQWWLNTDTYRDLTNEGVRRPILEYTSDGILVGPHRGLLRRWSPRASGSSSVVETPEPISKVTSARALGDKRVLVGTEAGDLFTWSPEDGEVVSIANIDGVVSDIDTAQTERGPTAVASTMAGDVFLVDLETHRAERLTRHAERVSAVRLGPQGRFVASSGWDKLVHIVDLGTRAVRVLRGHRDVVSTLAFSSDGRRLLSSSWDNTMRLWPVQDELHSHRKVLLGHSVGVHGVRFSPDGKSLVSGGHDNKVILWDLETGKRRVLEGHNDHVFRVVYSHDGKWVASSSDDMTVRLWNTRTNFRRVFSGHREDVEELEFSPNDQWLLSGSEDGTARLWEVATGRSVELPHDRAVTNVRFSKDSKRFATASRSGQVRLYNLAKRVGEELTPESVFEYTDEVWAMAFGARGNWFASADLSGALEARQLGTDRVVHLGPVPRASVLQFSPDERWLAVASRDGKLWLCEPARAQCRALHSSQSVMHTMVFTPDSRMLFAAGGDALLYAWDLETGEHRIYQGHRAPIFDLDVSPDGKQVATASADESVRLWPVIGLPTAESFSAFLGQLTRQTLDVTDADPSGAK